MALRVAVRPGLQLQRDGVTSQDGGDDLAVKAVLRVPWRGGEGWRVLWRASV